MRAPRPDVLRLAGLGAAVCLPLVVAVAALDRDWLATGDMAQAELHVRGFFDDPPLVGAAGRIGTIEHQGSHPGPLLWLAMLPGYRLLGQTSWALEVAASLVAAAFAVAVLVLARRRGGWPLAVATAIGLAVFVGSNGPEVFTEPWNPWLALLPFLAFVLLVWSVLCGDRLALPLAAAAGSFAVQCHVGYALLVGGLGALAAAWALRARWWRHVAAAAATTLVLWAPPLWEQLTADDGWPGNLVILWRHFGSPDQPVVGPVAALKAFAGELNVAGPWVVGRGHQPTDDPTWWGFAVMAALWGAAAWLAWRRRLAGGALARLHAVLGVACLLGVVSIARVFGDFYDYVIRWMWVLVTLVAVAVAWTAWELAAPRLRRGLAVAGAVAGAVAVGAASVGAVDVESSGPRNSEIVAGLAPEVAEHLDPEGRYLVRWSDTVSLGAVGAGLLLELEKRGFDVGADPHMRAGVLPHRVIEDECDATAIVHVAIGPSVEDLRADPAAEEIAVHDTRSPEERRRFEEAARRLDELLREVGAGDLTPVLDDHLLPVAVDPRLPEEGDELIFTLIELGMPGHAFLVEPPGCGS